MKDLLILLIHRLTTLAKLIGAGGTKAIATGLSRPYERQPMVYRPVPLRIHPAEESRCRMFYAASAAEGLPTYLGTESDPLPRYLRWQANLSILDHCCPT